MSNKSKRNITIIVPVYADWRSLERCISSLKKYVDTSQHKIILINDSGPEADLLERNIQQIINGHPGFTYYRNQKNLGFVKTCNKAALELDDTDNDILLLNSDTAATSGFLEEMASVLEFDSISVVSPRSNNATLATIPLKAASRKGISKGESYELFRRYRHKFPKYNIAPVAHGFCMLIRRSLIKEFGLFDEVFGKGYGEEVDFCQRIEKNGHKSAISNWAYVFHDEAKSFTLDKKQQLLDENNKIIWSRYPNYRENIRKYMRLQQEKEELYYSSNLTSSIYRRLRLLANDLTKPRE